MTRRARRPRARSGKGGFLPCKRTRPAQAQLVVKALEGSSGSCVTTAFRARGAASGAEGHSFETLRACDQDRGAVAEL